MNKVLNINFFQSFDFIPSISVLLCGISSDFCDIQRQHAISTIHLHTFRAFMTRAGKLFFLLASLIQTTAILRFSSALYIPEIASIAQNMSSASGDEAEIAMAEPGKIETQFYQLPLISTTIVKSSPKSCLLREVYARHDRSPVFETAISPKWRLVHVKQYKYLIIFLVRRTRSGRARKTVVTKKSSVKKPLTRATCSPRKIHEIEEVEV